MATEIIHGAPGAYKTSSLVSLYVLNALKENRTIVTNIRGFASIEKLNETFFSAPKKTLFNRNPVQPDQSTSEIIHISHDLDGFQKMARFFHWAPKGALILMDEGQEVYPSRLTKLNEYDLDHHDDPEWPRTVENAFNKHRHFGWDVYISTTNIAKIHKEIRQVAEYAFRHRNLAGLTGFKGRFKRVQHDPETSGKTLSHVLSTTYNKMDVRVFGLYGSTTTDTVKDITNDNQIFKSPKFIFVMLLFCAALLLLFYVLFMVGNPLSTKPVPSIASSAKPSPSKSHESRSKESSSISSGDVLDGAGDKDVLYSDLVDSIQFLDSTIFSFDGLASSRTYFFTSSLGRFSSDDLFSWGYSINVHLSYVLIFKDDFYKYVRIGDPNPTYDHFEDAQQLSSSSNTQPPVHLN
ncbi:Zona occludens toxin [gamma proteobacterium IMCC1989]|nr:Zona occludens toxin [gamma proteobacterium IMCC1989]